MKPINEYTLQECLEEVKFLEAEFWEYGCDDAPLASRIHELTRWIPVEERLPTFEDADKQDGCVDVWSSFEGVGFRKKLEYQLVKHTRCTHWQRINRPEGV
jgi:hypothetical protein